MTDMRRLMGIQGNRVRLSKDTPDTANGQLKGFSPLPPGKGAATPYRYAAAPKAQAKIKDMKIA